MEFTAIKGFKDILPSEIEPWQRLESTARELFRSFGYQEIKLPAMERTELFSRSIGQETDIVSKEMYTLLDSKGRGMTLRPEATASVVRAYIQNRLYTESPVQKLFLIGPMFRHENPQKNRLRQFHQIDAEIFGDPGPVSDADLIILLMFLFESLGIGNLSLHVNSLGCPECRKDFREALRDYLSQKAAGLCADCRRRSETNPMRVFDCKIPECGDLLVSAPSILDYLCEDCRSHFQDLQKYLSDASLPFSIDSKLVRGLDYYNRTAFEIQAEGLGAQNAVAGGGRYDGLVSQLGGPDQPAIGFAVGMERVVALLNEQEKPAVPGPEIYIAALGEKARRTALSWVSRLRKQGYRVEMDYASRGLKAQMKSADKLGALRTLIVGEDELASGKAKLRNMEKKSQEEISLEGMPENLLRRLRGDSPEAGRE